jgi:hypothetical protein
MLLTICHCFFFISTKLRRFHSMTTSTQEWIILQSCYSNTGLPSHYFIALLYYCNTAHYYSLTMWLYYSAIVFLCASMTASLHWSITLSLCYSSTVLFCQCLTMPLRLHHCIGVLLYWITLLLQCCIILPMSHCLLVFLSTAYSTALYQSISLSQSVSMSV